MSKGGLVQHLQYCRHCIRKQRSGKSKFVLEYCTVVKGGKFSATRAGQCGRCVSADG